MSEGRSTRRVYELDLLRFVAAMAVLLYHYTWRHSADPKYHEVAFPHFVDAWSRYGFIGVDLFFFISGLVIFRSVWHGSARRFFVSRVVRLFPAYWAMVTISFVVMTLWGAPAGFHDTFRTYLMNLTMLQTFVGGDLIDGVYWTLAVELVFYAVVWAALVLGLARRLFEVLTIWLVGSILVELAGSAGIVPGGVPSQFHTFLAVEWAPFFVGGACCALLGGDRAKDPKVWGVLALSGVAAMVEAMRYTTHRVAVIFPSGSFVPAVSGVLVLGCLILVLAVARGRLRSIGRPWMVAAGALTYPLYLVHQNVGYILFIRFSSLNRWMLLVVATGVMLGLAWGVHRLVEVPLGPHFKALLDRVLGRIMGRKPSRVA